MESRLLSLSSSRSRRHSKQLLLKEATKIFNWANLPGDLLPIIAEKASSTTIQYIHLRAVCRAWRRALTPHPHHLPPQVSWLMLPPQLRTHRRSDPYVIFYDIAQSKTYRLWLPYMRGKYCCGSSHGWLVLEYLPRVSLLNPITKRCIDLPSLDSPPTLLRAATSKRMRSVPSNQHKEFCRKKASLSCTPSKPGCVVVALFCLLSSNWHLGLCRIGDSQWTKMKQDAGLVVRDFAFYNNLVYTVNTQMGISVYDLQGCPLCTFPSKINFYYNYFPTQIMLVEGDADSSGPLIVGTFRTFQNPGKIMIFAFRWCDHLQIWRRVKYIGKWVLFLDGLHLVGLHWDEKKENEVYYNIRHSLTVDSFRVGINRANLERGKVVPHKPLWEDVFSTVRGLSLWVTPSLI